jgi:uncharacterized phage protein (TIGR01671 family)
MMTREIKFRAKDLKSGEWVVGGYYVTPITQEACIESDDRHVIASKTLGQYTGLRDENGTEIYEGDICEVKVSYDALYDGKTDLCVVSWDPAGGYTYEPEGGYGEYDTTLIGWAVDLGYSFRVIGNIYDNPELVKKGVQG